jgi:hypothetical protein
VELEAEKRVGGVVAKRRRETKNLSPATSPQLRMPDPWARHRVGRGRQGGRGGSGPVGGGGEVSLAGRWLAQSAATLSGARPDVHTSPLPSVRRPLLFSFFRESSRASQVSGRMDMGLRGPTARPGTCSFGSFGPGGGGGGIFQFQIFV